MGLPYTHRLLCYEETIVVFRLAYSYFVCYSNLTNIKYETTKLGNIFITWLIKNAIDCWLSIKMAPTYLVWRRTFRLNCNQNTYIKWIIVFWNCIQ